MKIYNDILRKIMEHGVDRRGRNGSTRALFAEQIRFNLIDGFPAVTTKKLAFKAVTSELLWFIEGGQKNGRVDETRLKELNQTERTIWTANAESDYWKPKSQFEGDLGRIYGVQWRSWQKPNGESVDQLAEVIEKLKTNPYDRRLIVTAWNPGELEDMALPPCHILFQFFVTPETKKGEKKKLSLHMVQRSCDMFLGVPFNIASYALLLAMVAHVVGMEPHEYIHTLNDAHIYHDHFDAVNEQLSRKPLPLPTLWLNPNVKDINSFTMDDIKLENYEHHPPIKAKMSV